MSALLFSAAFIALLAAGGVWAALPLLTGAANASSGHKRDGDSPGADPGFFLYRYGWKP